jgi:hypothetical protein
MAWLWWVLGLGCGGLLLVAGALVVYLAVIDRRNKNRVLGEGEHTVGWLVQANLDLYGDGFMDLPALVLISPDGETANDRQLMTELAEAIMDLKGTDPHKCDEKDDAFVAKLMSDETYVEGKRHKLPKRFARGRTVYLAHIFVYRDHLPGKKIRGQRIPCAVIWDDPRAPICTRPTTKKERRQEDDEI